MASGAIIVALTFTLLLPSVMQDGRSATWKYALKGRLVDRRGSLVRNGCVVLYPRVRPDGWDSMVIHHKTDDEGRFSVQETISRPTNEWSLYALTQVPSHAVVPFIPPFTELEDDRESFRGLPIQIANNQVLDVGDVPIQVYYRLVVIHLVGNTGEPLFTQFTEARDVPGLWLRVRDIRGDVLSEEGVPRVALRVHQSAIAVALPEGVWHVELALDHVDRAWHRLNRPLAIRASSEPFRASLKLSTGGWRAKTPQLTKTPSRAEARRKLRVLGFEYNANSFVQRVTRHNAQAVDLFLAAGMNPNARNGRGRTALMVAAEVSDMEIVGALLRKRADVNANDTDGVTALMLAAAQSNSRLVKTLLDAGANMSATVTEGLTPLILAAATGTIDNVRLLLGAGADINARDRTGRTALQWATQLGRSDIAELLKHSAAR